MSNLIVFMSDFGWSDPYVGIVKGVIEKISRGRVRVVDLTHDIPAFNIIAAAYVLYTSYRYFPRRSVFLVVVDPGVGTEREPVAIETKNYFFVGPNNGVLFPAASSDGIVEVRSIDNEAFFVKPVSRSFHGRDIFAPIAAVLALGVPFETTGELMPLNKLKKVKLIEKCHRDYVEASVVYIDHFGNVALGLEANCREELCKGVESIYVETNNVVVEAKCLPVFSHASRGELVFYVNSLGFPELAVNQGSAADTLGVNIGDTVLLKK